jgi:hypothetical protein
MMNVNFNGYGENVLTFIADSSLVEPGGFVKMTADGTVGKCSAGDIFCGVCVGLRGGYAAVQMSGYVTMQAASAKIIASARIRARIFFILFLLFFIPSTASHKKQKTHCLAGETTKTMRKTKMRRSRKRLRLKSVFDSPVIYGVRVETSNPYHLLYIESGIRFLRP